MLSPIFLSNNLEAGCDEAGRGCLAGPVTCAAVLLFDDNAEVANADAIFLAQQLNDSKKISEKIRECFRPLIEKTSFSFAVVHISPKIIDEINILQASILGMQKAVLKLSPQPHHLIVDGNRFNAGKYLSARNQNRFYERKDLELNFKQDAIDFKSKISYNTIIKGDSKFQSIAAASILAKTYRDEYMYKIDKEFPMYNWKQNKGYPTKEHKEAIVKYGLTKYHRLTFKSAF